MPESYRTPGVYVEEISGFPPSVAPVATAVPAFLGYTEKGGCVVARIDSLLDYESRFGRAQPRAFQADIDAHGLQTITFADPAAKDYLMYYGLSLYFRNGGGSCYIVSLGDYPATRAKADFEKGLALLEMEDEPTLIVLLDAVTLDAPDYYDLCNQALTQCRKLGDRFLLVDIPRTAATPPDLITDFRNQTLDHLMYGAAYHPYLDTLLNYDYDEGEFAITGRWGKTFGAGGKGVTVTYTGSSTPPRVTIEVTGKPSTPGFLVDAAQGSLTITIAADATWKAIGEAWTAWKGLPANHACYFELSTQGTGTATPAPVTTLARQRDNSWSTLLGDRNSGITVTCTPGPTVTVTLDPAQTGVDFAVAADQRTLTVKLKTAETGKVVADAWASWLLSNKDQAGAFAISRNGDGSDTLTTTASTALAAVTNVTLATIKTTQTALYAQIKAQMASRRVTLPPSPAVAGVYARVDRERGVWKAPANVGVAAVIGPVSKITHDQQASLNSDPNSGKSINAIRAFPGKGTLIWGARTLDGNSNEWRYIPVRRLFITVEESARKATAFAVFEPNDATTWLKVKAMLESYLYGLWEQGALAGPKPEAAYYVNIGLGKTMTPQDILEGRMIVELGIAAVRPAEFILLRFSHKMQEA